MRTLIVQQFGALRRPVGCRSSTLILLSSSNTAVAQGAVQPGAVVPGDVFGNGPAGQGPGRPGLKVEQRAFDRGEKRLRAA